MWRVSHLTTIIRFAFWILYNPLAWAYDLVSWVVSMGHWRDWQRTVLDELRGKRVLDLACGTGNLLIDLSAAGRHPVGLDISPHMVRVTRRKLRSSGIDIPLLRGRGQQLPFANAAFDSVVCTFPTDFIVTPAALGELARVLRPGGQAIIVAMAQLPTNNLWGSLLEFLYRITGQRSPLPDLTALTQGLRLSWHTKWKEVGETRVLLIVIERSKGT